MLPRMKTSTAAMKIRVFPDCNTPAGSSSIRTALCVARPAIHRFTPTTIAAIAPNIMPDPKRARMIRQNTESYSRLLNHSQSV